MATLIEELLPEPDIRMRHDFGVDAPPGRVFAALGTTDFGKSGLVGLLFALRSLPALLLHPLDSFERLSARRARRALTLARITRDGFGLVAERPGEEIVLGVTGRFWKASAKLRHALHAPRDRPGGYPARVIGAPPQRAPSQVATG